MERPSSPTSPDAEPLVVETADVLDTPEAGGRMIRGSAQRMAGYAVGLALGIGAVAVMSRQLGVVDLGRYVTVSSLVTIWIGAGRPGINAIVIREYSVQSGAARDRVMRHLLGMRMVYTALGVLAATGFAALAGYPSEMVLGTALFGVGAFFIALYGTFGVPLAAEMRLGWTATLDLLLRVGMIVTVVALAAAGAGLVPFLASQIPAAVAIVVVTVVMVRGRIPIKPAYDRHEWGVLFRRVLPYLGAALVSVLYLRLPPVLMSLLSDARQTGFYAAAFRVLDVLLALPTLLISSAVPILARAGRDDRARLHMALGKLFDAALVAGVGLGICMVLGARVAMDVVGGSSFAPAVPSLRLLGPAIVGSFLVGVWGYGLLALHRYRAILVCNGLALAVMLAVALPLISSLGARGAAIALSSGELSLGLSYGYLLMRGDPDLRISLGIVPRLAAAVAVAVAPPLLLGLPALPATALAATIYLAAAVALKAVPAELVRMVVPSRGR